jgi:hypothetical protein
VATENRLDKKAKFAIWESEVPKRNYTERDSALLTAGCFFWLWVMVESTIAPQLMHFHA